MKKLILTLFAALLLGIMIIRCNSGSPQNGIRIAKEVAKPNVCEPQRQDYTAFPTGYNYPLDQAVIGKWVANEQMDSIRMHAWALWAGINQQTRDGKLVWQTWYPVSTTFGIEGSGSVSALMNLKEKGKNFTKGMNSPGERTTCFNYPTYPDTHDTDYGFLANNGDIMVAGEYFNYEAYCHIRSNRLFSAAKVKSYLTDSTRAPGGQVPEFPAGAIILKHMFWPVMQGGYSALPVWDNKAPCGNEQYNGFETWPRLVAIDPTNQIKQKLAKVTYLHLPNYPSVTAIGKVVPIQQFYSWKIDAQTWKSLTLNDKRIIDSSFVWAYGRHFIPGDYLVSIAMHIITKEIGDWTMQSFWWHDVPDTGYYSKNKPSNIPGGTWGKLLADNGIQYGYAKRKKWCSTGRL